MKFDKTSFFDNISFIRFIYYYQILLSHPITEPIQFTTKT